jgi:hypothetical protein
VSSDSVSEVTCVLATVTRLDGTYLMHFQNYLIQFNSFSTSLLLAICQTGHADIDSAFGQTTRAIGSTEFDDPDGVVETLDGLGKHGVTGSKFRSYKMDETANWKDFCMQAGIKFSGLRK